VLISLVYGNGQLQAPATFIPVHSRQETRCGHETRRTSWGREYFQLVTRCSSYRAVN